MKYYLNFITMLLALNVAAQQTKVARSTKPAAYAIVKGHIDHNTQQTIDFYWFDLIGYTSATAPIDKTGDFILKIKIDSEVNETVIDWGDDDVKLDLVAQDTISLSWDANALNKTLTINTPNPARSAELYKGNDFYQRSRQEYRELISTPRSQTRDSVYTKINTLYNNAIISLLRDRVTPGIKRTAVDVYFNYVNLLHHAGLLQDHDLHIINPTEATRAIPILNSPQAFRTEQKEIYETSRTYRDFIFNYVRLNNLSFDLWKTKGFKADAENSLQAFRVEPKEAYKNRSTNRDIAFIEARLNNRPSDLPKAKAPKGGTERSIAWRECFAGLNVFNDAGLRDRYIARYIIGEAFQFKTFDDANAVYHEFAPLVRTPFLADTLKKFYAGIQRLKPGGPAPIFTLTEEHGKQVSLINLRGKVVYIDFWGVHCAPCVADIKEEVPALHQKYKGKNVVFVNICIDTDEKTWKDNLQKLKLGGVNLIAQGGTKHPVGKAYNIDGIPHYYLIDADGKIANNNAPRPHDPKLYDQLDKLLMLSR